MVFKEVCLFLLLFIVVSSNIIKDEKNLEYQETLNALLSRLSSNGNKSTENNMVFMPPTFSVDIVSLLRWAVETQTQNDDKARYSRAQTDRRSRTVQSPEYHYPKSFLNVITFQGKSYFFSKNQKFTWVESLLFCRTFGMDLVSIETKEEDDFILQHTRTMGLTADFIWTSGNKVGRSAFLWINGEQLIYEHWAKGEPGGPAVQHCIILYNSEWHDMECHQNPSHTRDAYFICEDR